MRTIAWLLIGAYTVLVVGWLGLQWKAWWGIHMHVDHPERFPIGRSLGRGWYVARVEGHDVTVRRGRFRGGLG